MNQNDYFRYLNTGLPRDIAFEKATGHFDKARSLIDRQLQEPGLTESLKASLLLQKEVMNRLPKDYTYSFEEAYEEIKKRIPDFKKEELQQYLDERRIAYIYIESKRMIFDRFMSVLEQYEDFYSRLSDKKEFVLEDWDRYKTIQAIKKEGKLAYRFTIHQSLKIREEAFQKGENYLVHLPIPRITDSQSDIRIEKASPEGYMIDEENSLSRSIVWNKKMSENEEFMVEYSYISSYTYKDLNQPGIRGNYDFEINEEEPHIVFSKFIRDTADELTQGIEDPLEKARTIYDYMTLNMKYSYQPAYFVMDNIPETCLKTKRGDCGVFAITFITLLRSLGIPAYFESSKCADEKEVGCHDWARFYIEPYGWLYADVSYGIGCNRRHYEEGRQYYFGNLDPFRMVANAAFEKDLSHDKKYFRNDPFDNQTGEVEDSFRGYINSEDYDSESTMVKMEKII